MALKYLSVDEMLDITATWAEENHADRRALSRTSSVGGLLPLIDEAHRELGAARGKLQGHTFQDVLTALTALDLRHDSYVRVAHYTLDAHIHLAIAQADERTAMSLEKLQARLLPDGLGLVDFSYREESVQARRLESRITEADKSMLANIAVGELTLLDIVTLWIQVGKELGELQSKQESAKTPPQDAALMSQVRNKWIRAVKTIRMVLRLMEEMSPTITAIVDKISRMERAAEERARREDDSNGGL